MKDINPQTEVVQEPPIKVNVKETILKNIRVELLKLYNDKEKKKRKKRKKTWKTTRKIVAFYLGEQ